MNNMATSKSNNAARRFMTAILCFGEDKASTDREAQRGADRREDEAA
jgi:hypothetical protein